MYSWKNLFTADKAAPAAPSPVQKTPPQKPSPLPMPAKREATIPVGKDHTEVIKGIRKAMVKTMTEAAHIPTFGYNDEIDMTRLVELRRDIKGVTESAGVRFSYMPIIVKVWKIFITSLLKGYHSHCEYRENLLLSNMPIFVKVERIYVTSLSHFPTCTSPSLWR